jgi:hypothetical protein
MVSCCFAVHFDRDMRYAGQIRKKPAILVGGSRLQRCDTRGDADMSRTEAPEMQIDDPRSGAFEL